MRHREELTAAPVPQRAAGAGETQRLLHALPFACCLGSQRVSYFTKLRELSQKTNWNLHSLPDMSPAPVKLPQPFLQVRCHLETANIS